MGARLEPGGAHCHLSACLPKPDLGAGRGSPHVEPRPSHRHRDNAPADPGPCRGYLASCSTADHRDLAADFVDTGEQLGEVIGLGQNTTRSFGVVTPKGLLRPLRRLRCGRLGLTMRPWRGAASWRELLKVRRLCPCLSDRPPFLGL